MRGTGKKRGGVGGGNVGGDAARLLAQLVAGDIFADLIDRADALVVDLPPFSGPGVGVARLCPKVVLVVQAASTPMEAARRAAGALHHPPVIINRAECGPPRSLDAIPRAHLRPGCLCCSFASFSCP